MNLPSKAKLMDLSRCVSNHPRLGQCCHVVPWYPRRGSYGTSTHLAHRWRSHVHWTNRRRIRFQSLSRQQNRRRCPHCIHHSLHCEFCRELGPCRLGCMWRDVPVAIEQPLRYPRYRCQLAVQPHYCVCGTANSKKNRNGNNVRLGWMSCLVLYFCILLYPRNQGHVNRRVRTSPLPFASNVH